MIDYKRHKTIQS